MAKSRKRIDGRQDIEDCDLGPYEDDDCEISPLSPSVIKDALGQSDESEVSGFIRERTIHEIDYE